MTVIYFVHLLLGEVVSLTEMTARFLFVGKRAFCVISCDSLF